MTMSKRIATGIVSAAFIGGTLALAPTAAQAAPAAPAADTRQSAAAGYDCGIEWYDGVAITKWGHSGKRVIEVQCLLTFHGYNLAVDGKFGQDTYNKVKALQKKAWPDDSSQWDGIVGKKTWAKLRAY
ncbi:peptidoglycan-binding domain-containing protein [Streptomyces sp. T-3]|nr:peptidoglycan-binding domain-containing protein [Streptomyces sp. T-3]